MASLAICRRAFLSHHLYARSLTTTATATTTTPSTPPSPSDPKSLTHFKVTLRRSGISLGEKIKGTLESLGLHRRHQTVYHRHTSEIAGMILKVKELVEVENVPAHVVRNKWEQRQERKAVRGYKVTGSKRDTFMHI